MLDALGILQLYTNALNNDLVKYNVPVSAVKLGIECMAHVYKGETVRLNSERSMIADYTDVAHRCAYLHKYAAFHTALVKDMLQSAINTNFGFFYRLVFSDDRFRLCSLGGGPGSDVIGTLAALHEAFSYFDSSATVVDYMVDWSFSFESVLRELRSGFYGAFGNNTCDFLNWRYIGANLLKTFQPDVLEALGTASLVTMIKFASAAACQDTHSMIRNIFTAMKPGSALLFIDNDGGGFHKLMMDAAVEHKFTSIFGPIRRENYVNELMRVKRFGYTSCFKTTVTVHVLQKPFPVSPFHDAPFYGNSCLPLSLYDPPPPIQVSLRSPLTPMLYVGIQNYSNNLCRTVCVYNPQPSRTVLLSPPHTPMPCLDDQFAQDENINGFEIDSPIEDIPQSPRVLMSRVATPFTNNIVNSPHYFMSPAVQGCFPLRISKFRHHVSRKINQVKSRAKALFKKKKKGKHPSNV